MAEPSQPPESAVFPTTRSCLFDPPDRLRELRTEQPICPLRHGSGKVGWLVTSHGLARSVLTDSRFGRGDLAGVGGIDLFDSPAMIAEFKEALEPFDGWQPLQGFIFMDPPEHKRFRRLLAPFFTTRRITAFRPTIERIVAEQLGALTDVGPGADLVSVFAKPVSLRSQCALVGIPAQEAEGFYDLFKGDPDVTPSESVAKSRDAWEYIRSLTLRKRLTPSDDLISHIARHDEFSDDEATDTAFSVFQGGLAATGDMIALGAFVLMCHPDQLEKLRRDPSIVKNAVEELLRYVSINHVALESTAFEDIELGGTLIHAGETVTVSLAAANRDPDKFDRPDELDLSRSTVGHLAFLQGIHMCLGQHLARVELEIGLARLCQHFPTLRLAVSAEEVPTYGLEYGFLRVHELPVAW